jgi:hypothetical protein
MISSAQSVSDYNSHLHRAQIEKIRSETLFYSSLNALGASLILISLFYNFNFSAFIVEFFWLLISLFGIGKYFLKKNKPPMNTDRNR